LKPLIELGLAGLVLALVGAVVLWLVSLARRDASIADRFWGLGFVLLAAWYSSHGGGWPIRSWLLLGLTAVWGIRLSVHIHRRNRGRPEDPRYARWRENGGASYWWTSLWRVFVLQALILWIVSAPLLAGQSSGTPDHLTAADFAGSAIWLIGFAFEAVGDAQLAVFRGDPTNAGKVLSTGLWRFTRHPNYFGDALIWWGFFVIATSVPGGGWTVFSPVLMTILLVRVSGVSLLENSLRATKSGHADYVARTSAFIPWPPRRRRPDSG
jgi:steroid 5-alpha reductase family enzyme